MVIPTSECYGGYGCGYGKCIDCDGVWARIVGAVVSAACCVALLSGAAACAACSVALLGGAAMSAVPDIMFRRAAMVM